MKNWDLKREGEALPLSPESRPGRRSRRRSVRAIRLRKAARDFSWLAVLFVCLILLYSEMRRLGAEISPDGVTTHFQFERCETGFLSTCVVDGDTFFLNGENIRLADIDAPEVAARCAREAKLAARATRRLQALLSQGHLALVKPGADKDGFGRKPRIVMRDGRSIGDTMIAEGLARSWDRRYESWCG
ncbi:thermonuclease family protein [Sphingosinicella rhizophila]|uniref:Thermonuclease family protein n=1 Tax=Sphingosinicella rhizophila TaxID=3050082 RepID=A0ABU3Q775_9SPHN|nr:thermonuclease family protein [Sphingosinicella sp. GR2756]MDT9599246.1 thermonuclease family protein [Sphingosinicella sp. GR2756]